MTEEDKSLIVITTVGTSIFTNYMKAEIKYALGDDYQDISSEYEKLEEKNNGNNTGLIKKVITEKWLKGIKKGNRTWEIKHGCINFDASAEIKSLVEIQRSLSKEICVYLLCTESCASYTASEILKNFLDNNSNLKISVFDIKQVVGLQINNFENFHKNGLNNLIESILEIKNKNPNSDLFLNITGGYKALIPFLTILGQLYNIPLYYIYENSSELIRIGKLPINYDLSFAEQVFPLLCSVDKVNKDNRGYSTNDSNEIRILENLIDLGILKDREGFYWITPIGNLFMDYISKRAWESPNALGIFMEFKLYEYFSSLNRFNKVSRGVRVVNYDDKNDTSDIDIKLDSEFSYIWVECKSFTQLFLSTYNKGGKIRQQIERQFNIIKSNINAIEIEGEYLNKFPAEYHLYIYKENYEKFDDEMIKYLISINEDLMKKNNITFKVFYFETNISLVPDEKEKNYKNPYYKILNEPLLSEYIKELNLNKEN